MTRGVPTDPARKTALQEALLDWLCEGRTVASFCREHALPVRTLNQWRRDEAQFALDVGLCKDIGHEVLADECLAIADDATNDYVERETKKGTKVVYDDEHVQRSRLRIDTRLKLLACWDPRRYGTKLAVGGDPDAPPVKLSDDDRAKRVAELIARAEARRAERERPKPE